MDQKKITIYFKAPAVGCKRDTFQAIVAACFIVGDVFIVGDPRSFQVQEHAHAFNQVVGAS